MFKPIAKKSQGKNLSKICPNHPILKVKVYISVDIWLISEINNVLLK
jgi:hypothetical protein